MDAGSRLGDDELSRLLQRGLTARLACCDAHGWPYVVPVWFEWDGEHFWLVGAEKAAWANYIRRDHRIALGIDDSETSERVLCQGKVSSICTPADDGPWVPIAESMAHRYLDKDAAAYIASTAGVRRWLFSIEPLKLVAWRGPSNAD